MKRYERMTKEEIIEYITKSDCTKCEAKKLCEDNYERSCSQTRAMYINQELEMKPRWATIKSDEDSDDVIEKFFSLCIGKDCIECSLDSDESSISKCLKKWMKEKVQV